MAFDVQNTLVTRVKSSTCNALQLDESTDVSSNENVLVPDQLQGNTVG
jgi:hypothetical protein